MSELIPISNIIKYAKICQYLSAYDNQKKEALKGSTITPNLPRILYMERKAVEWKYEINPSDPSLEAAGNYLYSLCGKFLSQAKQISGSGGGGQIIINPGSGLPINFIPNRLQFTVATGSSYMEPGDTSYLIPDLKLIASTLIISSDGLILGVGLSDRLSYTFTQTPLGFLITFNIPVNQDQLIIIDWISGQSSGSGTVESDKFKVVNTYADAEVFYNNLVAQGATDIWTILVISDTENMGGKKGAYKYVPGFTTSLSQIALNFND